jgi:competence ComEA-like helix-hairpin-helix protein
VSSTPRDGAVRAAALLVALVACVALARAELVRPPRPLAAPAPERVEATSRASAGGLRERGKIDLNTASEAELTLLPRIGPALAARIAAHREARGPFSSVDALIEVKGIGPKTLELIRPMAEAVSKSIPEVGEAHARGERQIADAIEAGERDDEETKLRAEERLSAEQHVERREHAESRRDPVLAP